jgi:hypothetical protein
MGAGAGRGNQQNSGSERDAIDERASQTDPVHANRIADRVPAARVPGKSGASPR